MTSEERQPMDLDINEHLKVLRGKLEAGFYRTVRANLAEKLPLDPLPPGAESSNEPWAHDPEAAPVVLLLCAALASHVAWRLGHACASFGVEAEMIRDAQRDAMMVAIAETAKSDRLAGTNGPRIVRPGQE